MSIKSFISKHRGLIILIPILLFTVLNALQHRPHWGKTYGYTHFKGEIISSNYRKFYLLTGDGNIFSLYPPKGSKPTVGDRVEVYGYAKGNLIKVKRLKIYKSLLRDLRVKIHRLLKERFLKSAKTPFEKKLGSALLFGENWFSKKERSKFSHLGIYHLIVISGMHYALFFLFFLLFPVRWKLRYILAFAFFAFFTYLVLFPKASAYRAFISFALFLLAKILERQYHSLKALIVAAIIGLSLFPHWLFNIGFLLSYLASLSLILYYGGNRTPEENFFKNALGKFLGLEATLVVSSAINPILAYKFHFISFGGFLYTALFTALTIPFLFLGLLNTVTLWSFTPLVELQHLISKLFEFTFNLVPDHVYLTVSNIPLWAVYAEVLIALAVLLLPIRRKIILVLLVFLIELFSLPLMCNL